MQVLLIVMAVTAILFGSLLWYCVVFPRHPDLGPLPKLTSSDREIVKRLQRHITAIAQEPRNLAHFRGLEAAAQYIDKTLHDMGLAPVSQSFEVAGKTVRNIEVVIDPVHTGPGTPTFVVGAHYDTDSISPGAHDNGTGVAALLELARLLKTRKGFRQRIRLVFWVNEEHPYGKSPNMGSWRHAKQLKEQGERVAGVLALETIGYFDDYPGSQDFPRPFDLIYKDTGNFIAFVALPGSRLFLGKAVRTFRRHSAFPAIGGLAPGFIQGADSSDHWAYSQFGYPALMITDTAPYRNPYYHSKADLPQTVDYVSLAHITIGVEKTIRNLTD